MPTVTERVSFPNAAGVPLAARIERPIGPPSAYALFAHCFTCSKDLRAARTISGSLAERGIAVVRFDFTGLGESEGDFADTDFSSNLADLAAAADWMRREHEAPGLLIGHSLGGAAVVAMAERVPEAKAVATINAPSDTAHLAGVLEALAPDLGEQDEAEIQLAGRPFRIRRSLVDDLSVDRITAAAQHLGRALLVFHSPIDEAVGVDHARRLFRAAKHPKSFVSLDSADHLLTRSADAQYVGAVLAAWASRYLAPAAQAPGDDVPKGEVLVTIGSRGFSSEVRVGRHRLPADEPVAVGGADAGPDPYGYLLGGLGACTAMTLRMYADRKQWPLEGVEVRLRHSRIHATDCGHCETEEGQVSRIEKRIALKGPLDAAQRERLLDIAHRCPVNRTLTSEIDMHAELAAPTV